MKKEDVKNLSGKITEEFFRLHREAAESPHMQVTLYICEDGDGMLSLYNHWDTEDSNWSVVSDTIAYYPLYTISYRYIDIGDMSIDKYIDTYHDDLAAQLDDYINTVCDYLCTDGRCYDSW